MVLYNHLSVSSQSLHQQLITNPSIHKVETLAGEHYLHWSNADKIAELSKEFISTHLKK